MNGRSLLAGVLEWELPGLEAAISHVHDYRIIKVKKHNGSPRILHAPHEVVKAFQRRFLHYFLYRTLKRSWMERGIVGFVPHRSIADNANLHLRPETRFTYSFDFQDAFPSVKGAHVRQLLEEILFEELALYVEVIASRRLREVPRQKYPNPPLFSSRKVKWFRKLLTTTDPYILQHQFDPHVLLHEFINEVVPLVTHNDRLPQGAPTSPYLLNLVVCRSGMLERIRSLLTQAEIGATVTIYADDITVSVARALSRQQVLGITDEIERGGVFTLNSRKTRCFNGSRISPMVTGLRLVKYRPTYRQRKKIYNRKERRIPVPPHEKLIRDQRGKVQHVLTVSVPKCTIRKIRGLIHRAIIDPSLRPRVAGYIAYLRNIYDKAIPNQVAKPYKRYMDTIQRQASQ